MTGFQQTETTTTSQPLRIVSILSEGPLNTVLLVQNQETAKLSAAKILTDDNRDLLSNVETEASLQRNLDHSRILKLEDYQEELALVDAEGNEMSVAAILTEYAPRGDLFDLLCTFNQMPLVVARSYAKQMAESVFYLHEKGIAHQDIKLENYLLDEKFNAKLGDFGYSRMINKESRSDCPVGTPTYWAPEQHEQAAYNGFEIDIFNLGVTLFMLVAGRMPFEKATKDDEYYMHFINGEEDKFWQKHEEELGLSSGLTFFKDDLRNLINGMFCYKPSERMNISEVMSQPWLKVAPEMIEKCGGLVSEYLKKMGLLN